MFLLTLFVLFGPNGLTIHTHTITSLACNSQATHRLSHERRGDISCIAWKVRDMCFFARRKKTQRSRYISFSLEEVISVLLLMSECMGRE
jgi:hypothetical protein